MSPTSNESNQSIYPRSQTIGSMTDTEQSRAKLVRFFSLAVIVLVVMEMLISFYLRANRLSALQTQQTKLDEVMAVLKKPDNIAIEKQLVNISRGYDALKEALGAKIDYGRFWSFIQDTQLSGVSYSSIFLDDRINVKVEAKTSTYEKVAKQLQSLKQTQGVVAVALSQIGQEEDRLRFGMTFQVDPSLFIKDKK